MSTEKERELLQALDGIEVVRGNDLYFPKGNEKAIIGNPYI